MEQTVHVDLGSRSYDIHIGPGLLDELGMRCRDAGAGERALLVTDSNVGPLYAGRCLDQLAAAGITTRHAEIPAGEPSKQHGPLVALYEEALEAGLDRNGTVIALGGGVVGDLAGFLAASYLRGVRLIQVPTSLLAMVDSSVGGKTGVNLARGKNLVGAFHQPALVLVDTEVLDTLPPREGAAGLAEVAKYGVIRDATLFERLEAESGDPIVPGPERTAELIRRSCEIKAEVVRADEREGGLRAILNYGHTLGHAVEKVTGYTRYLHGEAVGIGMAYAAALSARVYGLPAAEAERQIALFRRLGLPVHDPDLAWPELFAAMKVDKKSVAEAPRLVLCDRIGHVDFGIAVAPEILEEVWHGRGQ